MRHLKHFARLIVFSCLGGAILVLPSQAGSVKFLEQNWNRDVRQEVYTLTQGSQMISYPWIRALERSDSTELFLADGLARHGYIPNPNRKNNPDGLPVGFTIDKDRTGWWFGMTCSACHTNQIQFKGTTLQIDGAPTLADMYGLLTDLRDSLDATVTNDEKFERFARRVLGRRHSSSRAAELREKVSRFLKLWKEFVTASTSDPAWGHARLDAFGMIFNRVSAIDLDLPQNNRPPNAPVSYPFLWGTSSEDKVQWNGSAKNKTDLDRLGRNVGEVLGVFAKADLKKPTLLRPYYKTTARGINQIRIENRMKTLWSPQWPEDVLGSIDQTKAAAGKQLFQTHCVSCHQIIPHGQQATEVDVVMTPITKVKTDPAMAGNACERTSLSGDLEGAKIPPIVGDPLPREPKSVVLLGHVVRGAIFGLPFSRSERRALIEAKRDVLKDRDVQGVVEAAESLATDARQARRRIVQRLIKKGEEQLFESLADVVLKKGDADDCGPGAPLMAYKARPLDGIWATAPYLHNGSVANLYELLLKAEDRMKTFHVGSREFDTKNVGFSTDKGPGTSEIDTSVPGNLNTGHDMYGNANFSEDERRALVEYMKTL